MFPSSLPCYACAFRIASRRYPKLHDECSGEHAAIPRGPVQHQRAPDGQGQQQAVRSSSLVPTQQCMHEGRAERRR